MKIVIREASQEDNTELLDLLAEVQKIHIENRSDIHLDVKVTFEQVYGTNIFNDSQYKVFVAVNAVEDLVVGYTILRIIEPKRDIIAQNSKKFVYLHELCVNAKYRRNNIGKLLMEKSFEFGREIGAASLELGVWEFNSDAIKFYEKMGLKTKTRKMEIVL